MDPGTRIDGLEARLEGLTRRVQALEGLLASSPPGGVAATVAKGEPLWEFDDYARETPFQVIQRSLDRDTGRIDLLLGVTAPIPDLAAWAELEKGAPVPLHVIHGPIDGPPASPLPLRLERGAVLTPGARLHVSAHLEPAVARQARQLRVVHTAAPPQAHP
jgi:hypothetical protein